MSSLSTSSKPQVNRIASKADEALDLISDGFEELASVDLSKLGGKALVDTAARMDAQRKALEKLLLPLKESIESQALTTKPTEYIRGSRFKAVLTRYQKSFTDFESLKNYLGTKYSKFQETKTIVQLTFEPQE